MKKIYLILTLLLLNILIISCNTIYESLYQHKPLKVDGLPNDWGTTLDGKNSDDLLYSITNDNENLYIRLNTSNQSLQKKILMSGLSIWIDTTGKKLKNQGIICPTRKAPNQMGHNTMGNFQDQSKIEQNNVLLEAELIGFSSNSEHCFISNNPYNIEVSFRQDEFKSFNYEAKIPFVAFHSDYEKLLTKEISIGFEVEGMERPNNMQMGAPPGGMKGGNMGGQPGGMSGGRPSGGGLGGPGGSSGGMPNQSDMQDLSSTTKIWIKNIKLSRK